MAEFALVAPILLLVLMSVLQFALVLGAEIGITSAVRDAARTASTVPTMTGADATTNGAWTYGQLTGTLLPASVQSYRSASLVTTGTPRTQVCYSLFTGPGGSTGMKVKVEVQYAHSLFIPIIGPILDGLDGNGSDGGLRIGAAEEITVENFGASVAPTLTSNPQCAS